MRRSDYVQHVLVRLLCLDRSGDSILFFGGIGGYCGGYAGDNRDGAIIGSAVAKTSACDCAQHCGSTTNCVAWTFDSMGQFTPGTPSCYLRSALGGYVGNCPGCISASMDWYGTTLRTVTVELDLTQWKFNMHYPAGGVPAAGQRLSTILLSTYQNQNGDNFVGRYKAASAAYAPATGFSSSVATQLKAFVAGGRSVRYQNLKEVWACSVDNGTAVTPTHTPTCVQQPDMTHVRVGLSLVVFDGDLYAIGGETNTTSTFLETFDGTSWTAPAGVSLPVQSGYTALGDTAAVVLAGTILALRLSAEQLGRVDLVALAEVHQRVLEHRRRDVAPSPVQHRPRLAAARQLDRQLKRHLRRALQRGVRPVQVRRREPDLPRAADIDERLDQAGDARYRERARL